jgi:hypothetical protein
MTSWNRSPNCPSWSISPWMSLFELDGGEMLGNGGKGGSVGGGVEIGGCVGGGVVGGGEVDGGWVGGGVVGGGIVGGGGNVGVVKGGMVGGGGNVGVVNGGWVGGGGTDGNCGNVGKVGPDGDVWAPADVINRLALPTPATASTTIRRFHVRIADLPASVPTGLNLASVT